MESVALLRSQRLSRSARAGRWRGARDLSRSDSRNGGRPPRAEVLRKHHSALAHGPRRAQGPRSRSARRALPTARASASGPGTTRWRPPIAPPTRSRSIGRPACIGWRSISTRRCRAATGTPFESSSATRWRARAAVGEAARAYLAAADRQRAAPSARAAAACRRAAAAQRSFRRRLRHHSHVLAAIGMSLAQVAAAGVAVDAAPARADPVSAASATPSAPSRTISPDDAGAHRHLLVGRHGPGHCRQHPRRRLPGPPPAAGAERRRSRTASRRALGMEVAYAVVPGGTRRARDARDASVNWRRPWPSASTIRRRLGLLTSTRGTAAQPAGRLAPGAGVVRARRAHPRRALHRRRLGARGPSLFARCRCRLGELAQLSRRLPVLLRKARERDDLNAVANLRTRLAVPREPRGRRRAAARRKKCARASRCGRGRGSRRSISSSCRRWSRSRSTRATAPKRGRASNAAGRRSRRAAPARAAHPDRVVVVPRPCGRRRREWQRCRSSAAAARRRSRCSQAAPRRGRPHRSARGHHRRRVCDHPGGPASGDSHSRAGGGRIPGGRHVAARRGRALQACTARSCVTAGRCRCLDEETRDPEPAGDDGHARPGDLPAALTPGSISPTERNGLQPWHAPAAGAACVSITRSASAQVLSDPASDAFSRQAV